MEEEKAWKRGVWETVKEAACQKLMTWRLPSPPLLRPNQLTGLTVIVTGATSGIGLETARELVMSGAHVIMACRNVENANRIAHEWKEEASEGIDTHVEAMQLDLSSLSSVHKFADEWKKRAQPLHILINNAGAFYMQEPQKFTEEGLEQHIQVNHVAPALLTLLLLPSLLEAPTARIVNVNSVSHHCSLIDTSRWKNRIDDDKYVDMKSYGESKLAQLMFLKTLVGKLLEKKIMSVQCVAVSPGIVNTKLVKQASVADWKLFWMLNPAEGARSVLFCATESRVTDNLENGFAYYNYACKPTKEATHATDKESCLNVWRETLEILNLDVDYLTRVVNP